MRRKAYVKFLLTEYISKTFPPARCIFFLFFIVFSFSYGS